MNKLCKQCGKLFFKKWLCEIKKLQFCSHRCHGESMTKIPRLKKIREKIARTLSERKRPELTGKKHPGWIGDKVGRYGVHDWIKGLKGKAEYLPCELKDTTCRGMMDWSNKSGEYRRRLSDWWTLCRSHHRRYDYKQK